MPTIINSLEVISSLSDNANLFAMNFATNTMLDNKNNSIPDFLHLTEHRYFYLGSRGFYTDQKPYLERLMVWIKSL